MPSLPPVRVTEAERAAVSTAARSANQTIAQYIRFRLFGSDNKRRYGFTRESAIKANKARWNEQ